MKQIPLRLFFALCALHGLAAQGDNFNDNSKDSAKWGSDSVLRAGVF